MVSAADFISLKYTSDLTQGGLTYACKMLAVAGDRLGSPILKRLRRIVVNVAVELAFRRYLNNESVPHKYFKIAPFTDPDRYDIAIGGRRCNIKSYLLTHKNQILQVRQNPNTLLAAQALVPRGEVTSSNLNDGDLYIFGFLNALITPNLRSLKKAADANQPLFLIHTLPPSWFSPTPWRSLGKIVLKSDNNHQIKLGIGGQGADRGFLNEQITLNSRERFLATRDYYTLGYLQINSLPDGLIGLHSPILRETHLVKPVEWGNIWVYGMRVIFTGYITRGEFLNRAHHLPAGTQIYQYRRTQVENLALPIADLHPIENLFAHARSWRKR